LRTFGGRFGVKGAKDPPAMVSHLTQALAALSLLLSTHASMSAWPELPLAGAADQICPEKARLHTKASTKVAARRVVVVTPRQSADVQVISFGP
jgi:hypothetical protein